MHNIAEQNYPTSVASYDTQPGNNMGLFYMLLKFRAHIGQQNHKWYFSHFMHIHMLQNKSYCHKENFTNAVHYFNKLTTDIWYQYCKNFITVIFVWNSDSYGTIKPLYFAAL